METKPVTKPRLSTGRTLVLLAAAIVPSFSRADSYMPFCNFRQSDATGRYYIVVKKYGEPQDPGSGTRVTFELAERAPGSAPVTHARDEVLGLRDVGANPDVMLRQGDTVIGRGRLERCPSVILISSTGLGFVGLDVRGYNYGDMHKNDALVVVSADGRVRHRKAMIDLFGEREIRRFAETAGGIHWCGGGWIDETRKEVVVVGGREFPEMKPIPRLFRVVSLETGGVRKASSEVVLTALSELNRGGLDEALDLAAELALARAKPDLVKIFSDDQLPIRRRLQAAIALAALGDRRGGELMTKLAFEDSPEQEYAVYHLARVLGDEAAGLLCDVVRRFGKSRWNPAWQAMHHVSASAAMPPLLRLLREDASPTATNFVLESLAIYGSEAKPAVPDLIKILDSEPKTEDPRWTHKIVAIVLGHVGPDAKEALPALIKLAEKEAPEEWEKVRDKQPAPRDRGDIDREYSDDLIVNAICEIRAR